MPLPVLLIPLALKGATTAVGAVVAATAAGTVEACSAVHGAKKMKDANDTINFVVQSLMERLLSFPVRWCVVILSYKKSRGLSIVFRLRRLHKLFYALEKRRIRSIICNINYTAAMYM